MGIKEISTLSTNPHYYAFLLLNFLSGYDRPCEARLPFMALPILLYSESREKLVNANSRSKMESLFSSYQSVNDSKITGKTRLAGYLSRYNALMEDCKKAIIILSSENKIAIKNKNIVVLQKIHYSNYDGKIKDWSKSAYYLGLVFAKADEDHLCYFLGVNKHE
jgi:hypothetical protein